MKEKHLYIIVGTKNRELDAKVLLAAVAADKGYHVYLGSVFAVEKRLHMLPNGIFIKQLISGGVARKLKNYNSYGHKVCAFDEEGLVFPDAEAYKVERVSPATLKQVNKFFAWGEYNAQIVREVVPLDRAKDIIPTGHPRLDILRPEWRDVYKATADNYRKQHGPYILINSNFDLFNHVDGREAFFDRLRRYGRIRTAEAEKWFRGWAAFRGFMYRHFRKMIRECALSFPDKNFIVRPHPSENHEAWRKFTEKLPNVKIIHLGAAIPWIMGSEGLIHNGCTTAVEAFVLDKPVLSYRPFADARYDNYLPNALGYEAFNIPEAKKWIEMRFTKKESGNQHTEDRQAIKDKYMSALNGLPACERVVNELNSIAVSDITLENKYFRSVHIFRTILKSLSFKLAIRKGEETISKDSLQRNSGIQLIETQNMLSNLSQIDKRFSAIRVFSRHEGLMEFIKPS